MERIRLFHAAAFTGGSLTALVGLVLASDAALLIGGVALAASGLLSLAGVRVVLAGPAGAILRAALGGPSVAHAYGVGLFWLVVGVLLTVWGVHLLGQTVGPEAAPSTPTFALVDTAGESIDD